MNTEYQILYLKEELEHIYSTIHTRISRRKWFPSKVYQKDEIQFQTLIGYPFKNKSDNQRLWNKMVFTANKLHQLTSPKYRPELIAFLKCSPENPKFYNSLIAVKELLKLCNKKEINYSSK